MIATFSGMSQNLVLNVRFFKSSMMGNPEFLRMVPYLNHENDNELKFYTKYYILKMFSLENIF